MADVYKVCPQCELTFIVSSQHAGRKKFCSRECGLEYRRPATKARQQARYRANRAEYIAAARLSNFRAYGITPEQYDEQVKRQDGRCLICRRRSRKSLAMDHDHSCCPRKGSCGRCLRGLLCADCNRRMLGGICQETTKGTAHAIEVLERAIAYLRGELPEQEWLRGRDDVDGEAA